MWSIRKLINKRKHVDTENRVGKKEPVEGRWNQCFLNKRSFINVKLKSLCNMNPNLLVHTYIFIVIQCVHVNLCWFFHLFFHVSISTCWKSYILFHQIKVIVFLLLGTWIVFQGIHKYTPILLEYILRKRILDKSMDNFLALVTCYQINS